LNEYALLNEWLISQLFILERCDTLSVSDSSLLHAQDQPTGTPVDDAKW
jgi:hypothetical protein